MPRYRLFFISPTPRHVTERIEFDAPGDHEAHVHAETLSDGRAMELWEEERVVRVYAGERKP